MRLPGGSFTRSRSRSVATEGRSEPPFRNGAFPASFQHRIARAPLHTNPEPATRIRPMPKLSWFPLFPPPAPLLPLLLFLASAPGEAQVIRSYESLDRRVGEDAYATFGFTLDAKAGNTEYTEFDLAGAVGYRGEKNWIRFYPTYNLRRSGSRTEEHARSAHLRHSFFFDPRTRSFAFVQIQADESLEVQRRFLVGGGLRRSLVVREGGGGIDLGVGVMYENERIETGEEESVVRGTNLLVVNGSTGPVALTLTGFFQPLLDDWADHRVSAAGSAAVPLGTRWDLEISLNWRRDSRPPMGVEPNDAGITVGLRFAVE